LKRIFLNISVQIFSLETLKTKPDSDICWHLRLQPRNKFLPSICSVNLPILYVMCLRKNLLHVSSHTHLKYSNSLESLSLNNKILDENLHTFYMLPGLLQFICNILI
jgi:hypothetical protein